MDPSQYFDRYIPPEGGKPTDPNASADSTPAEDAAPAAPSILEPSANPNPAEIPDGAGEEALVPSQSVRQMGYAPRKRYSWPMEFFLGLLKAAGYFVLYLGLQIVVEFAFGIVWYVRYGGGSGVNLIDLINSNAMLITLVSDVIFLAAVLPILYFRRNSGLSGRQNRGLLNRVKPGKLALIVAIGITLNFAVTIPLGWLQNLLPQSYLDQYAQTQQLYSAGGLPAFILAGVIFAPIVEELVFRGLIATRLSRGMPAFAAIAVSALIFGIVHGTLFQGIYTALLGLLLGTVFFREDSLLASIALHFGFNLGSLPAYVAELKGVSESGGFLGVYMIAVYLSIPICLLMLACYFLLWKKKKPVEPGEPGVNAWLMRE